MSRSAGPLICECHSKKSNRALLFCRQPRLRRWAADRHGDTQHNRSDTDSDSADPDAASDDYENANWPELIAALSPGPTAFDNPAISTLVFKKRLEALLYNVRHGKYFGCKRVAVCEELYTKVFSDIECFTPFFCSLDELSF